MLWYNNLGYKIASWSLFWYVVTKKPLLVNLGPSKNSRSRSSCFRFDFLVTVLTVVLFTALIFVSFMILAHKLHYLRDKASTQNGE